MTEFQTSDRDVSRAIRSWLHEDRHEDASRIAAAVLDRVEATPERRAGWPAWRTPTMNRIVTFGLGAAAVVAVLLIGAQFLRSPVNNTGGPGGEPTETPQASASADPSAEPSQAAGLSEGWHRLWQAPLGVHINVTIPAPGWHGDPRGGVLTKNDNADAPDGAGLIVFAHTNNLLLGLGDLYVYGDPCRWASTRPDAPVSTVDEAVAALSGQVSRDPSAPVNVTVDGYAGQMLTMHVPDDAVFADCDDGEFRTLVEADDAARSHQDPGQIDKLWILDVDGELVIIDAGYYQSTPQSVLDEIDAIVESADLGLDPDAT
jgi:hypothetical protein